ASTMVTWWVMREKLGLVQLAPRRNPILGNDTGFGGEKPFSEAAARLIDDEVRTIIGDSYEQSKDLLNEHRKSLDAMVEALLTHKTLDEEHILEATGLPPAPK